MSKITNDGLTRSGTACMLYSCTHVTTVIKGLRTYRGFNFNTSIFTMLCCRCGRSGDVGAVRRRVRSEVRRGWRQWCYAHHQLYGSACHLLHLVQRLDNERVRAFTSLYDRLTHAASKV